VNRSYDIFSLGAVGCGVLGWLTEGEKVLKEFRDPGRKSITRTPGEIGENLFNFYCEDGLKPVVKSYLSSSKVEDGLIGTVAGILEDMLSYRPQDRPTAKAAQRRFAEALGHELPPDEPLPVEVRVGTLQVPGPTPRTRRLCKISSLPFQIFMVANHLNSSIEPCRPRHFPGGFFGFRRYYVGSTNNNSQSQRLWLRPIGRRCT
jgi:hypothetical protein